MSGWPIKTGSTARGYFTVWNSSNAAVTGLVNADFTKLLAKDGSNDATTLTVAEVANGRYTYTFAITTGEWYVLITNAIYNARGWDENWSCSADGIPTISDIVSGVWAQVVDTGYTALRTLRNIASGAAGKVSGLQTGAPVFRNQADTVNQITATTDTNGNRTAVTHGS